MRLARVVRFMALGMLAGAGLAVTIAAIASASDGAPETGEDQEHPLYLDPSQPLEARVEDLLARLTLEEKVSLVHADSKFSTNAIPHLNIPKRWMSDGPHGVREDVGPDTWMPAGHTDDFASHLPVLIDLASSWNPDLARAYGETIGQEARKRGKDIMLGPGLNIMRTPLNGRNFEYFGEDPFLTSRMAVNYVRGAQSEGIASCVKHFAANNQEWQRGSIDVEMDERTLREIYLPAFKAAVQEGGAWAVMGAYNKFRGQHCCHNDLLLNRILKTEWGFKGLVISDWGGVHDTREAALNGLDLEMGTNKRYDDFYLARPYLDGLRKGEFPVAGLDDKVRRNLRVMFATHVFDTRPPGSLNTPEHQTTARRIAEEGAVLLKNEAGALPLDASKIKSIAVIGENAVRRQAAGGGSAGIKALYEITPLEGITRRAGALVDIDFSMGYCQQPQDGQKPEEMMARAVRAASQADVAVVFAGLNHSRNLDDEGTDRKDLALPYGQDDLIQRVAKANPHTIVVLISGGPIEMDAWLAQAPAVLQAWYPGMEGGNALARILFGDVNPSGKLPCTFPHRLADSPAHALGAYPGTDGVERYDEGLLVGYRHYDTKNVAPLFPFGHGLSYTRFEYSALKLVEGKDPKGPVVTVEFDITNTGAREGGEVAQLYVGQEHPRLPRPLKELKGFQKVFLKPGEKRNVSITLDRSAFAFYDLEQKAWVAEKDSFKIMLGASSRDIRAEATYRLAQSSRFD